MSFLNSKGRVLSFGLSKAFKGGTMLTAGVGFCFAGSLKCGNKLPEEAQFLRPGVYQMRAGTRGRVPVRMRFYVPTNPATTTQQANRSKFADAMSAWGALTTDQKAAYTKRAKRRNMFGWGLFIREYYQLH